MFFWLLKFSTERDVLIVCRQHNDKEWEFKEQHAKMRGNIAGGEKILSPPWFQHCGNSAPAVPTPPCTDAAALRRPASAAAWRASLILAEQPTAGDRLRCVTLLLGAGRRYSALR